MRIQQVKQELHKFSLRDLRYKAKQMTCMYVNEYTSEISMITNNEVMDINIIYFMTHGDDILGLDKV